MKLLHKLLRCDVEILPIYLGKGSKCGNLVGNISACIFLYLGITMHSDVAGRNYYFLIFYHA